ncbi:ATP-binding protein [Parabacteroides sp.]
MIRRILYLSLGLAILFAGLFLLSGIFPLRRYDMSFPLFELLSIILLLCVLYLYRRDKRQEVELLLKQARRIHILDLSVRFGNAYAFEFKEDTFLFEFAVGDLPNRVSAEEMYELIHPDDLLSFKGERAHLWRADKESFQFRARFSGSDYEWWEFRYSSSLEAGHEKEVYDIIGLLVNINEMKKREEELLRAKGHEQKFLANMSHEIRTPLNAIVGFSNLLVSEKDLEETDRQLFIHTINQNCDLLLVLINDILEISRIESGQMKFVKERCSVKGLVDDLYLAHRLLVPAHLRFSKEAEGDLFIYTDKKRLSQVITNFLTNACKFTNSGYVKLGFKYLRGTDEAAIFVEDSGSGLSEEQQEKVFSRFFKQDEFSQGAGLGLCICQGIVQNLGGRIALSSKPGEGSRFSVVLPVYKGGYA